MFNVVFTDEGRALIAEIASDIDYSLLISDVKYSEHDYTGQEASVTEATFTGDFASGTKSISVVDSTTMRIETYFNNQYINEQKDLYSIGIFAKCVKPNGMIYTEIDSGLLAVCTVSTPRIIPPYADAPFSVFTYNINLAVGSTDNVTVVETQAGVQYKELATPIDINGDTKTTVEGALSGLNDYGDALADNLAANEESGAKNLNVYPYQDTTKTDNGITFTDNGDGTVTVSGTAGATATMLLHNRTANSKYALRLKAGNYKVNGCPSGSATSNYYMYLDARRVSDNVAYIIGLVDENGLAFTVSDESWVSLEIRVASGTVISTPITFKPMIRDARILDPTFAPFAKTNKQLTNDKAERADLSTIHATGSTNTTGSTITIGTFFYLNGVYCKALTDIAANATFTENTNYEEDTAGNNLVKIKEIQIPAADFGTFPLNASGYAFPHTILEYTGIAKERIISIIQINTYVVNGFFSYEMYGNSLYVMASKTDAGDYTYLNANNATLRIAYI